MKFFYPTKKNQMSFNEESREKIRKIEAILYELKDEMGDGNYLEAMNSLQYLYNQVEDVPLPFFFQNNPRLAIPWIAIPEEYIHNLDSIETVVERETPIISLAISEDGNRLYFRGYDDIIFICDTNPSSSTYKQSLGILRGHGGYIRTIKIFGNYLYSGSDDRTIKIWDIDPLSDTYGNCLKTLSGHSGHVLSISITEDKKRLYSGSLDKTIKVWDIESNSETYGNCLSTFGNLDNPVCLSIFGRKNLLFSYDYNGCISVKIWDVNENSNTYGYCLKTFDNSRTCSIAIFGNYLYCGDSRGRILIGNVYTDCSRLFYHRFATEHTEKITSLVISPCGKYLCSSSKDGTIILWDIDSNSNNYRESVKTFSNHQDSVNNLLISEREGTNLLYSANSDGTVKIWEM